MNNVVDSSAWLEYFADGKSASNFEKAITNTSKLLVPTLCIFEVFKKVLSQRGEDLALQAVALMQQGRVIELSTPIAVLFSQQLLNGMLCFGLKTLILRGLMESGIFLKTNSA